MDVRPRILVVYYSRTGHTGRVAGDLAARLGADLARIEDKVDRRGFIGYLRAARDSLRSVGADIVAPRNDPADYALTIVGTPVWAWHMTPAVRTYLRNAGRAAHDLAFFVTSGNTAVERVAPDMEAAGGRKAVACAGFDARELADPVRYQAKLAAFLASIAERTHPGRRK